LISPESPSPNLSPEDIARAGSVRWGRLVRAFRYYTVPWRVEVFSREEPREVDAIVVSRVVPLAELQSGAEQQAEGTVVNTDIQYRPRRQLVCLLEDEEANRAKAR